jgi:hypothetical protein
VHLLSTNRSDGQQEKIGYDGRGDKVHWETQSHESGLGFDATTVVAGAMLSRWYDP